MASHPSSVVRVRLTYFPSENSPSRRRLELNSAASRLDTTISPVAGVTGISIPHTNPLFSSLGVMVTDNEVLSTHLMIIIKLSKVHGSMTNAYSHRNQSRDDYPRYEC